MRGLGADQDIHQPIVETARIAKSGDRPVGIEDDTILKQPGGELGAKIPCPPLRLDDPPFHARQALFGLL